MSASHAAEADRPRILDLFSGAGGSAMGYHRAGFTVVGVDKVAKVGKHYPFEFHHGDALEYLAAHGHAGLIAELRRRADGAL